MAQHPFLHRALARGVRGTEHPLSKVLAVYEGMVQEHLPREACPMLDFGRHDNHMALIVTTFDDRTGLSQYFFKIARTGRQNPRDAALQIKTGPGKYRYLYLLNNPASVNAVATHIAAYIAAETKALKQQNGPTPGF